jgi:hypothetical protein
LVARLHEKDVIKTVRISPLDAQKGFSSRAPVDKVSGDVLHHFGGFFKRSWRSNDILWGRLDGLCELVESLLRRERFEAILADDNWRHEVRDCLFVPNGSPAAGWAEAMTPALLFPHAGAKTQTNIGQWLVRLFSDIKKDREEALASFDRHVELIIEAAQLEVLHEDLPMVITDALEEQALWNQFRVSVTDKERESKFAAENLPEFDAKRGVFRPGDGDLDPLVVTVAAEETAKSALEKLQSGNGADAQRPAQTKLGTFFTRDYKVGSEALMKDMPRLVLLEILASSLLVLRNCILGVLGPHAEKVKRSPLYILALECPLRSFQALVLFLRRAPRTWRAIQIGLALLSILALVVGITWWSEIIYPGEFFVRWFVIFIALPLLILVSQCVFLWGGRVRDLRWMRVARDTVIALLLLTPLIPIVAAFMGLYRTHGISLVEMCILYIVPFVAPFVGGWLACRLGKYRRAKPKELQHALEEYFSMDDMKVIEKRLGLRHIPSLARMWTASEIVRKAAEAGQLAQLESAMRSINPESLM